MGLLVAALGACGGGDSSGGGGVGGGGGAVGGGGVGGGGSGNLTYSVTGSITGGGGISVQLTGPTNATVDVAADGSYTALDLPAGTYTVAPAYDGATFAPTQQTVTVSNADVTVPVFAMQVAQDTISPQLLSEIEQGTPEPVDFDTLTFPDGTPLSAYLPGGTSGREAPKAEQGAPDAATAKKKAIAQMIYEGTKKLQCGRPGVACPAGVSWTFGEDKSLLPNLAPKQTWLAYSYGSKQVATRGTPEGSCSNYRIHGIDCSGFVSLMAQKAGITAPAGTAEQQHEKKWDLSSLGLTMGGTTAAGDYQVGDLLVWQNDNAKHIGIVLENGPNPKFLSSMGRASEPAECAGNVSNPKRGPVTYTLSGSKMGTPDKVLRIQADSVFTLNVATSWRPKFFDYDTYTGATVIVPLTSLNDGKPLPAGSSLELTAQGQWYYNFFGQLGSGAAGRLLAGSSVVLPAAGSTTFSGGVPADCQTGADPYLNDFLMAVGTTYKVVLPASATVLELGVDDCVMADNSPVASDPIRVKVKLVLPP